MKKSNFLNLLSVIFLTAIVLGVVFLVNPMRTQIDQLDSDLDLKNFEVDSLTARVAELETLQEELATSGTTEEKLLQEVPVGFNQDELLTDLSDLSDEAGIVLNSVGFSVSEGEENGVVTISASFDGDYEDLIGFLETIEDNTRKLKVKTISVQLSEEGSTPHVSFGLAMEAYYQ
ncbi:MAG: hypothetical protein ACD_65C00308G0001 [uncultured bacterium]|nr:MAG: hypothetical protein ACD_65C00308G0001 [uncultured bacterium]